MPDFVRVLLRAWGRGILEVLLFYPAFLLLAPVTGMDDVFPYWVAALTLYMPLGALTRLVLRTEIRVLLLLVSIILVGGGTWLAYGLSFPALVAVAAGGLLFYHGFRSVRTAWYVVFPVGMFWIGLFLYMPAAFILPRISQYEAYTNSLTVLGAVSLVVTLFFTNTNNLKEETHSGSREVRLAQGVVWKNRLLIGIVLVVVLIIGLFGPLKRMFTALKNFLLDQINWLISLMNRPQEEAKPEASATPPPGGGLPPGDKDPSAIALFLEKVAYYVGMLILIAIILSALYVLVKVANRQIRRLIAWLREREALGPTGVQEYEEEKTNLMDWNELRRQLGDRVTALRSRFEREPSWEKMSSAERVRHLYRAFVRRSVGAGAAFKPHLTPRELLTEKEDRLVKEQVREELGKAYNAARYGGEPVDESLTNRLKKDSGL